MQWKLLSYIIVYYSITWYIIVCYNTLSYVIVCHNILWYTMTAHNGFRLFLAVIRMGNIRFLRAAAVHAEHRLWSFTHIYIHIYIHFFFFLWGWEGGNRYIYIYMYCYILTLFVSMCIVWIYTYVYMHVMLLGTGCSDVGWVRGLYATCRDELGIIWGLYWDHIGIILGTSHPYCREGAGITLNYVSDKDSSRAVEYISDLKSGLLFFKTLNPKILIPKFDAKVKQAG